MTSPRPWLAYVAIAGAAGLALLVAGLELGWRTLFLTPDQRGRLLMARNDPANAAVVFRSPAWRGVALFRAGNFEGAAQTFAAIDTPEGAYDQSNALVMLGRYEEAVARYDRALALRPDWADAVTNREIARIRGERRKAEGGVTDDTESSPDEIVYDKTKKGGTETQVAGAQPMSDEAVRALWLKRVQTRPADFLKARFAFQLQSGGGAPP